MGTKNHPWNQHRGCFLLTLLVGARAFILPSQQCRSLSLPIQLATAHRQLALRPLDQRKTNDEDDPPSSVGSAEPTRSRSLLSRFTNPQIDDPGLILTDGLVVQVIAPTLQIAARLALGVPAPTWLQSTDPSLLFNNRPGALLAPTLLHGAALDLVWLVGALAARAYERPAISPIKRPRPAGDGDGTATKYDWDYSRVYQALIRAGAAATGLWIFATQVDVYMDMGDYVQWGDSMASDARLVVAATEGIADFIFEAITITFWRLYLAYQTERMDS
jgi:hypothetical protein